MKGMKLITVLLEPGALGEPMIKSIGNSFPMDMNVEEVQVRIFPWPDNK